MKKIIAVINLLLFLLCASGKLAEEAIEQDLIFIGYVGEEETK